MANPREDFQSSVCASSLPPDDESELNPLLSMDSPGTYNSFTKALILPLLQIQSPNGSAILCTLSENSPARRAKSKKSSRLRHCSAPSMDSVALLTSKAQKGLSYFLSYKSNLPSPNTEKRRGQSYLKYGRNKASQPRREPSQVSSIDTAECKHKAPVSCLGQNLNNFRGRNILRPQFRVTEGMNQERKRTLKVGAYENSAIPLKEFDASLSHLTSSFYGSEHGFKDFARPQNLDMTVSFCSPGRGKWLPKNNNLHSNIMSSTPLKF
ncbi:hypothetical protein SK128_015349 [Halocaridina rubra]|uniref:Uncharacterized protein n=1 Tax=Halocaridina rubra TaxID=373956 RepID=A0AAN8ZWE7_HALRR